MAIKVAPLNSSFMVTSILGLLISIIWVYKQAPAWGAAFTVVFALMFISSIVSMTYGPADTELRMDAPRAVKKSKK
jgi:multisubunit Na+/H+ antiporter MnhB subunit